MTIKNFEIIPSYFDLSTYWTATSSCVFNDDWTILYVWNFSRKIKAFSLWVAYDITTASYISSSNITFAWIYWFTFSGDWLSLFICQSEQKISQYSLSSAWDITTLTLFWSFATTWVPNIIPLWLYMNSNWTKVYSITWAWDSTYFKKVLQRTLSTPYDITTAWSFVASSALTQDTLPYWLFFKPDWTKLYTIWDSWKKIYQYSLSSAWDISTISYDTKSISTIVWTSASSIWFTFNWDWSSIYFTTYNNKIYSYNLSVDWILDIDYTWLIPIASWIQVGDREHNIITLVWTTPTLTIKIQWSMSDERPDFSLAQSETNRRDYIIVKDYQSWLTIAWDTGISYTWTGWVTKYEINTNWLKRLCAVITSYTSWSLQIYRQGFNNK